MIPRSIARPDDETSDPGIGFDKQGQQPPVLRQEGVHRPSGYASIHGVTGEVMWVADSSTSQLCRPGLVS